MSDPREQAMFTQLATMVLQCIDALENAEQPASSSVIKAYLKCKCGNNAKASQLVPYILREARSLGLINKYGRSYRTARNFFIADRLSKIQKPPRKYGKKKPSINKKKPEKKTHSEDERGQHSPDKKCEPKPDNHSVTEKKCDVL